MYPIFSITLHSLRYFCLSFIDSFKLNLLKFFINIITYSQNTFTYVIKIILYVTFVTKDLFLPRKAK